MTIYIEQYINSMNEGEAGIGAASVGCGCNGNDGGESVPEIPFHECPGIDTEKVLGKFDPKKGCMGKGDFHIPKVIMPILRRWPVVNYKKKKKKAKKPLGYVYENGQQPKSCTLVYNIPSEKVESILDSTKTDNKRYDRAQITKYLKSGDDIEFVALFNEFPKECLAMAVLQFDKANAEDCYVCEIQSFAKGFGKKLLLDIMKYQKNLWLMANVTAGQKLLDFYRDKDFNFNEYCIQDSVYGCPATFFYTKSCNKEKIEKCIDSAFKEN